MMGSMTSIHIETNNGEKGGKDPAALAGFSRPPSDGIRISRSPTAKATSVPVLSNQKTPNNTSTVDFSVATGEEEKKTAGNRDLIHTEKALPAIWDEGCSSGPL